MAMTTTAATGVVVNVIGVVLRGGDAVGCHVYNGYDHTIKMMKSESTVPPTYCT